MKRTFSPEELRSVVDRFQVYGDVLSIEPYGSGHINDTFRVTVDLAGNTVHYILQRINSEIFTDPAGLMQNITRVTRHLREKLAAERSPEPSRRTLTLVQTRDGGYVLHEGANWWRVYLFIEKAKTYDVISSPESAFAAAQAFAAFQNQLADLPGARLNETIPAFHNIESRLALLDDAFAKDAAGRAGEVAAEMAFVQTRREEASRLLRLCAEGSIPERITHNDTKINNVMFDDTTNEGICVIDLDTVMPGLALYDFGDMVRTATAAAAEDETDLVKVESRFDLFEALVRGYCSRAAFLTQAEKDNLAFSGRLITFTIGVRFLTDYLAGDVYFKTHRPGHNLDRARNQFKMVESQERQAERREALVREITA
ncbi:MAG: aminoglycoside phosphotransferase family protein [Kiritimatiellae bacterium]|nr:aminoglycoside phosphotransferase family protein [Kiritimatiellia bacterium]